MGKVWGNLILHLLRAATALLPSHRMQLNLNVFDIGAGIVTVNKSRFLFRSRDERSGLTRQVTREYIKMALLIYCSTVKLDRHTSSKPHAGIPTSRLLIVLYKYNSSPAFVLCSPYKP